MPQTEKLTFPDPAQGATTAQARAALRQYKDVMQAAERFFEGKFDHITDDDGDVPMASTSDSNPRHRPAVRVAPHDFVRKVMKPDNDLVDPGRGRDE